MTARLIAGPWVGEFGWELMSWQGYVRAASENFDETICFAPEGHRALYDDFADRFVPVRVSGGVRDCWKLEGAASEKFRLNMAVSGFDGARLQPSGFVSPSEQKFIRFGDPSKASARYDLLFHVRGPIGKKKNHAWSIEFAERVAEILLDDGLSGATIGSPAQSLNLRGMADLRGMALGALMNEIAAAGVVVGPSSGPMHLASLCGTPHVVWTDKAYYSAAGCTNRDRYERIWNPLNAPVDVIDDFGWSPPAAIVVDCVRRMLCLSSKTRTSRST